MSKKDGSKSKSLVIMPAAKQSGARRPTPNPPLSDEVVAAIAEGFSRMRALLEEAAANIRQLDRARLNGVGIKTEGFIERAYTHAAENPQFMPAYLTNDKFGEDFQYFLHLNTLYEMVSQLREFIWKLTLQSADIAYTDALEFYASVREAAKRRIDGSETIYKDLEVFFRKTHAMQEGETKKQLKRDFNAILRGDRDGVISIENIKPKMTGGVRKVVDEKFTGREQFKETKEGEIDE